MNIVASTKNGFLLDATANEIALILGFRSSYDDKFALSSLCIGAEIEVKKFYDTAEFVRHMDKGKLVSIKDSLTRAIAEVDAASESVNSMNIFEIIKEAGNE
jgi:hypothetical protein